jgi:hypothetical protein
VKADFITGMFKSVCSGITAPAPFDGAPSRFREFKSAPTLGSLSVGVVRTPEIPLLASQFETGNPISR